MLIDNLIIKNFKSIVNINIQKPGNFLVFVGANASGKSNILEALDFAKSVFLVGDDAVGFFGGINEIRNFNLPETTFYFYMGTSENFIEINNSEFDKSKLVTSKKSLVPRRLNNPIVDTFSQFTEKFSRIFCHYREYVKFNINDDVKLRLDCGNLEKVLGRLLKDEKKREEIIEVLQIFIPELKSIEIIKGELSDEENLLIFEEFTSKPFSRNLISNGTYNILSLITSVFQSDEPQFLCIEEPENGLNPKVVKELIHFLRAKCKEKEHYIWLSTHSQTLVSCLSKEEIVIVNKKHGNTEIQQVSDMNLYDLSLDEAWLSNVLGGGIPW